MFAGTDGGYSKHGNGGYELGNLGLRARWFPVVYTVMSL